MTNYRNREMGVRFLAAVLAGVVLGADSKQLIRAVLCPMCRNGIARDGDGNHMILGVAVPCAVRMMEEARR